MNIEQVRFNMIEQQIRPWDVLDTEVLDLLHVIKRENFLPASQKEFALMDIEVPLTPVSNSQKMWTPKMEARVLQEVQLHGHEHVLEVGTGSGYLTALLAARSKQVTSVEIDPALAKFAEQNLANTNVHNASVIVGDGAYGYAAKGPYDVIVFTGAMEVMPEQVFGALKPGGKIFVVLGRAPVMNATLIETTASGARTSRTLFETVLAPLTNSAKAPGFVF